MFWIIIVTLATLIGFVQSLQPLQPPPRQCPEGYYEIPASDKSVLKCLPFVSPLGPGDVIG